MPRTIVRVISNGGREKRTLTHPVSSLTAAVAPARTAQSLKVAETKQSANKPNRLSEKNHMNVAIVSQVNYGNAEVRGQLRVWKQKLARDYAVFESAFCRLGKGDDLGAFLFDMVRCGRVGRQRAFEKINRALGPGAKLETKHLDDKPALAVWSIFCPRSPVWCAAPDAVPDTAQMGLSQNCVTVNCIVAGALPGGIGIEVGLWTLGIPDHALGRAIERSRLLHPGTIIREAHTNLP